MKVPAISLDSKYPRKTTMGINHNNIVDEGLSAAVRTLTNGRGDASHRARPGNVPGHCCRLGCSCCLSCCCLLLHLPVALTQVKHLAGDKTKSKNCSQFQEQYTSHKIVITRTWNAAAFHFMTIVLQSHLDVSAGVDLVNCVSRGTSSLSVQVIALHKHCMITQTAHPDVSFTFALQLHAFANVEPKDRKEGKRLVNTVREVRHFALLSITYHT